MLSQKIMNNSKQEDLGFSSDSECQNNQMLIEKPFANKAPVLKQLRNKKRIKYFNKNSLKLDLNKVIGNNNGKWKKNEQLIFIECFIESGNEWNRLEDMIETRNRGQIRSHAQKFFERLSKLLSDERRKVIITPDSFSKFIWPLAEEKKQKIKQIFVNLFLNDSHTFDYENNNINNHHHHNNCDLNSHLRKEHTSNFNKENIIEHFINDNESNVKTNQENIEFYDLGALKEEIVEFCERKFRSVNEKSSANRKKQQAKKKLTNIRYFEIMKIPKPLRKVVAKKIEEKSKLNIRQNFKAIGERRFSIFSGKSNESSSTVIEEDKQIIL